jgi:flagellar biosynthetic protein FliR
MSELAELAQQLEISAPLLALALVLARVGPLVTLLPFLGGGALSPAVRGAVTLAVAVAVFPAAAPEPSALPADAGLLLLGLKELLVGTSLGLVGAVAFHVLSMAGELVDQARGGLGQVRDPSSGESASPLATFHLQVGVVLFLLMGGHRAFLAALAGSYEAIPLAELPLSPQGTLEASLLLARLVGGAIAAALMLAAPAISAILLTDLAMGLLGRAAPQVGTAFMALPLRAAVGLAMVLLTLSVLFREVTAALWGAVALIDSASGLMGP